MGYASLCGKAVANPYAPRAFGTCDRCQSVYNHVDLRWQMDYRGRNLANIRILVCERCEDKPQPQLKPRVIPPDPTPILNARPYPYCAAETDDRVTTNPALKPVSRAATSNVQLSGLQFIEGEQVTQGELILALAQTNSAQNNIYKASSGLWALQAYDNDKDQYVDAATIDTSWSDGVLRYGQLGTHLGTVSVSRGSQASKLFQIQYVNPSAAVSAGTITTILLVSNVSAVNRYDFWTGIYMEGKDYVRVTQEGNVRTPQQVGQAAGSINEIPGYSNLVPGFCDIGRPNQVPYGCATRQGLPSGMDILPFSGALWPQLSNQSIGVWLNSMAQPFVWLSDTGTQVTFKSLGFWANPGPGAPSRPIAFGIDYRDWVNIFGENDFWNNTLGQNIPWRNGEVYGIYPPGGEVLWRDEKCVLTLWHNKSGTNVNWSQIYKNAIAPNAPGPWPWGFE